MIINTKGVELSENKYLDKAGKFLFKIDKFEEDGYTNAGDAKFKLQFKGVEVGTKEPVYLHTERFSVGQASLWKIKTVEVALKAPEIYDINDFVGRYIIANIVSEQYIKNDSTQATSFKAKSFEYSPLNDKLPPIPEAKEEQNDGPGEFEVVIEDVNEDELPF